MKKFLLVLLVAFFSINQASAQFRTGKKKKNDVSVEDIMNRVHESEAKREHKPEVIIPVYSPEERAATLAKIRKAKSLEDLPVLKSVAYFPNIDVFGLKPFYNEITDQHFRVWRDLGKMNIGDTITVYAIYELPHSKTSNEPGSIKDLRIAPYRNGVAQISPNLNDSTKFVSWSYFCRAMWHYGDIDLYSAYEGRRDTILLREEYLKQKEANK